MEYQKMNIAQLQAEKVAVDKKFEECKARGLQLNMARGKPGKDQLDMVSDILNVLINPEDCLVDGQDSRSYGQLLGLPCAKEYFADVLGCQPDECFVGGNSSLALMYDLISKAYTHGLYRSEHPWCQDKELKFLCPAPGYDRHFRITESFGMTLIPIDMKEDGPDMDAVERYIQDPTVKGMWCVPKYSNPQGIIYSDEVVNRIANMKPAAQDFALMWDNAYCVHTLVGECTQIPDIISLCREAGRPDMAYEFASTSKITFPGAGISVMASSEDNIKHITALAGIQTIGYDKVNQLRHVRYLKNKEHTLEIMARHAEILRPKFNAVLDALDREIAPLGIATWTRPLGGYFISVDTMDGIAKRTLALCKEAGVVMTSAGATYPYGKDPRDRNIRIAPSMPPVKELEDAIQVFCVCLRLAALEYLLAQ